MTILLKQSTAVTISFGPAVLNSDGVTYVTNLTGTGSNQTENTTTGIRLSKNGGALAARHATAGASNYDAFGMYLVPLDATDTGTLGNLRMTYGNAAAFCPITQDFMVVAANIWDALIGATVGLKVDVDTIKTNPVVNGGTITFPTTATLASTTNITAAAGCAVSSLGSNVITSGSINAAALNGKGDWATVNPTNLTAAQIATGVWQDTTAGDFTTSASIGKSIMNGVALGTGLTVNDLTTKTGFSLISAYDPAKTASQAGDAMALTSGERTTLTGVVLTTAVTESYRAKGAAPTLAQAVCEMLAHMGEVAIVSTTKTINGFDGVTAKETFTLDSATTPAAITRAT